MILSYDTFSYLITLYHTEYDMDSTTALTGLRKTIYIPTQDVWNEIVDSAEKKDWSVSRYLVNCHKAHLGAKPASPKKPKPPEPIPEDVPEEAKADAEKPKEELLSETRAAIDRIKTPRVKKVVRSTGDWRSGVKPDPKEG